MFGSQVLDVAIVFAVAYIALALACTAINASLSRAFRSRLGEPALGRRPGAEAHPDAATASSAR